MGRTKKKKGLSFQPESTYNICMCIIKTFLSQILQDRAFELLQFPKGINFEFLIYLIDDLKPF